MEIRGIVFSGVMSAILMSVVGADAATLNLASKSYVDDALAQKQNTLTAGEGIDITDNVVKSTIDTSKFAMKDEIPGLGMFATDEELAQLKTTLEAAIAEKQDKGDYASATKLQELQDVVNNLQTGGVDKTVVENLKATVEAISADYAKKTELTATEERLQAAIDAIKIPDLTDYAKSADVAATYATKDSLSGYATVGSLSGYATTGDLDSYAKTAYVANTYATKDEMNTAYSGYAKTADVAATYATKDSLSGYATTGDLDSYAKTADVANTYATKDSLSGYATVGSLSGYATTGDLDSYAKTAYVANTYATKDEMNTAYSGYAKTADVAATYATKDSLSGYATVGALSGYATTGDLDGYAKTAYVANTYATKDSLSDYAKASDLANKAETSDLNALQQSVTNIENTYLTQETAQKTYVTENQVTERITQVVGTDTSGLKKQVADNTAALEGKANVSDVYSKTDADSKFLIMRDANALGANLQWDEDGKLNTKGIVTAEGLEELETKVADAVTETELDAKGFLTAGSVVTGAENGTIAVGGTDIPVKGLGSAAYTETSAYVMGPAPVMGTNFLQATCTNKKCTYTFISYDDVIDQIKADAGVGGI